MRESQRFSLARGASEESHSSELLRDGRACGSRVEGTDLEAEFQLELPEGRAHLLFVTHDTPHEEILHLYLVAEDGRILEHRELGGAYAPGVLKEVEIVSNRELRFHFQGRHQLRVRERPKGVLRRRRFELKRMEDAGRSSRGSA